MITWVKNELTIEGDKRLLDQLARQLNQPFTKHRMSRIVEKITLHYTNPVFAFWNIVRPADDLLENYIGQQSDVPKGQHWLDWNIEHWGTMFDVGNADHGSRSTSTERISDSLLKYEFQTVEQDPHQALIALSSQFPSLSIANRSLEETQEHPWVASYFNGELEPDDEVIGALFTNTYE